MKHPIERTHLSVPVVAQQLGVAQETLLDMIHSGELLAVNLGRGSRPRWKIPKDGLQAMLDAKSNRQSQLRNQQRASRPEPSKRFV